MPVPTWEACQYLCNYVNILRKILKELGTVLNET